MTAGVCVIQLLRNSFRLTSRKYWDQIARELKLVYTAPKAEAARAEFAKFTDTWGQQYPAIRLWDNAWEEFTPFLAYEVKVRRILFSTNAIESLNARYRRAVRARGYFPNEQAALKCLYLVTRSLDPPSVERHDGPCDGSQHSTCSRPSSRAAGPPQRSTNQSGPEAPNFGHSVTEMELAGF